MKKLYQLFSKLRKFIFSRIFTTVILMCLQIYILYSFVYHTFFHYNLAWLFDILRVVFVLYIINRDEDSQFKISWCILILLFPVFGGVLYLLCEGQIIPKKLKEKASRIHSQSQSMLIQNPDTYVEIQKQEKDLFYLAYHQSKYPIYQNSKLTFYPNGQTFFCDLLQACRQAKHFIFLEYFILEEGQCLDALLEILEEKVKEGVSVKMIYDDIGCLGKLSMHFEIQCKMKGIDVCKFNRLRPALAIQMNNRTHRKIAVIDNQIAFTGGINLADEYMNVIQRLGEWRDSAIKIEGEAVWSFTCMFLSMYAIIQPYDYQIDYEKYHLKTAITSPYFVQPFSDSPKDHIDLGLQMHLNLIKSAKHSIYIDTPYLILTQDLITLLKLASFNGVDVRILTPGIPDKKFVFYITQANYDALLQAGVKIYEYTPGFNHTKQIVVDDNYALTGTINMDYRSYYLHFEDGVLLDNPEIISQMKQHFLSSLEKSRQITKEFMDKRKLSVRIISAFLKLFAPLC